MDQTALLGFLQDASRRGYAAGCGAVKTREADRSTTIVLEHGEWRFHDNYFGGEPYGGREVVFFRGQPVWMAVYFGGVDGANVESVYSFLQRALREAPAEFLVRGPDALTEGRFSYRNVHEGDVVRFWGEETIHANGGLVYTARYAGGLVDRRSGD
ncbi:MAG: hypothetical protein DMD96_00475 [Candidatus Rokuibacteriota bacterium]|nr:MAG: hypothetical protein DMD96_00475 [Candidatus Rokubacteria bacterium]